MVAPRILDIYNEQGWNQKSMRTIGILQHLRRLGNGLNTDLNANRPKKKFQESMLLQQSEITLGLQWFWCDLLRCSLDRLRQILNSNNIIIL